MQKYVTGRKNKLKHVSPFRVKLGRARRASFPVPVRLRPLRAPALCSVISSAGGAGVQSNTSCEITLVSPTSGGDKYNGQWPRDYGSSPTGTVTAERPCRAADFRLIIEVTNELRPRKH